MKSKGELSYMRSGNYFVHPSADVSQRARIGSGTRIWHQAHIREGAVIGERCVIGKDVYIDHDVRIGNQVKIQNGVSVYYGVTIEDNVFVGPSAVFTNDRTPRAFASNWLVSPTTVKQGASIGANATIVCGITVGEFALIGAGAVIVEDAPAYSLVVGNPGRVVGRVDKAGNRLTP